MLSRHALIFAVISITLITLTLFVAGCSPAVPKTDAASKYAIDIYLKDLQLGSINLDQLLRLKQVTVNIAGNNEQGPTLLSALNLASIKDFSSVTVYGNSNGSSGTPQYTLQKTQIDDKVILRMINQGTSELVSPNIPSSEWIMDITKIVAQ